MSKKDNRSNKFWLNDAAHLPFVLNTFSWFDCGAQIVLLSSATQNPSLLLRYLIEGVRVWRGTYSWDEWKLSD